ncbi:DUF4158 domain-containing protein [Siccirubricoccus deserti]
MSPSSGAGATTIGSASRCSSAPAATRGGSCGRGGYPQGGATLCGRGVCADATALADYARRPQTRREQLGALRDAFGFRMFGPGHRQEIAAWLLPVALATTDAAAIAAALMDELRRRRILALGRACSSASSPPRCWRPSGMSRRGSPAA